VRGAALSRFPCRQGILSGGLKILFGFQSVAGQFPRTEQGSRRGRAANSATASEKMRVVSPRIIIGACPSMNRAIMPRNYGDFAVARGAPAASGQN
jgi:hypothetical protein